ncbi:hypothetical protein ACHAQJ_003453 [Trichoderma viride]
MNSNSDNSSDNTNMSLIGHHGGLSIGKAERPGPSQGKKSEKLSSSSASTSSSSRSPSLERRGLGQMIGGILHGQRRDEAQARAAVTADDSSETASLSSVATEKRALLGGKSKTSSASKSTSRKEPKLPNINESMVPRGGFR